MGVVDVSATTEKLVEPPVEPIPNLLARHHGARHERGKEDAENEHVDRHAQHVVLGNAAVWGGGVQQA